MQYQHVGKSEHVCRTFAELRVIEKIDQEQIYVKMKEDSSKNPCTNYVMLLESKFLYQRQKS
jgi:hypothetical protein